MIRFSNRELPPFWGAGTRLFLASFLFMFYMVKNRYPLPRGRALAGALLFGTLQFGVGFALAYWALLKVPAGLASVILASTPLFTLLFAGVVRIESITIRGVLGSLFAIGGIAVVFGEGTVGDIPPVFLLATIATALSFASVPVVIKLFPPVHPSSMNGVGMLTGALILLGLSFITGETAAVPAEQTTWVAFFYLVLFGSVGAFTLMQFILNRWTATGISYQSVLSPFLTIVLSAWLLDEPLSGGLFIGAVLVIIGVYIGAISPGYN